MSIHLLSLELWSNNSLPLRFSEQTNDDFSKNGGTNSAFTFLTAHGSFLQTLTHGFSGHRPREDAFFFDPSLPPQFTNYTLTGMKWQGEHHSRVSLTRPSDDTKGTDVFCFLRIRLLSHAQHSIYDSDPPFGINRASEDCCGPA